MKGGAGAGSGVMSLGRIAIVGAGQVGTMLGMALMAQRASGDGRIGSITLFDVRPEVAEESLARRAGDDARTNTADAFEHTDTLILAVPVPAIVELLERFGEATKPGALVIDTGGTKRPVVDAMRRSIPPAAHAIGGHPMAGSEVPGPAGADPDRLRGAVFVLTPVRDDPDGMARASSLVEAVGARPFEMDANTHDRAVALTSHVPHLLAFALAAAAGEAPSVGMDALISTGFIGATRLAETDPATVAGFLTANAEDVAAAVAAFRGAFDGLIGALGNPAALERALAHARDAHRALVHEAGP